MPSDTIGQNLKLRRRRIVVAAVALFIITFECFNLFLPATVNTPSHKKPIILYYDYGYPPLNIPQFPSVVNYTLGHGFNTLMMLVYLDNQPKFNASTIQYFIAYSKSKGLTFVPSYYIRSTGDQINVSGLTWVNLDMERLDPSQQLSFYNKVARVVPFVSVTSPYDPFMEFHSSMTIEETYASSPWFWFAQLGYYHPGKICSVGDWMLHSQMEYNSQRNYCLKYTGGVMVYDYYNLPSLGFN